MRKDVKLGMAIGGVLLTTGAVYLGANSAKKHPTQGTEITDNTGDNPAASENTPTAPSTDGPAVQEGANTPDATPRSSDAKPTVANRGGPDGSTESPKPADPDNHWIALLNGQTTRTQAPSNFGGGDATHAIVSPALADRADGGGHGDFGGGSLPGPSADGTAPKITPAGAAHVEPAASHARTHTVAAGENYSRISAAAYGTPKYYALIAKANPNIEPTKLRPGMQIVLPELPAAGHADAVADAHGTGHAKPVATVAIDATREYRVQSGDSLHKISSRLYGTISMVDKIYEANRDTIGPDKAKLKLNQLLKLPSPPTAVVH